MLHLLLLCISGGAIGNVGEMSPEVGNMEDLVELDLSSNSFSGE